MSTYRRCLVLLGYLALATGAAAQQPAQLSTKQVAPYLAEFADCDVSKKSYRANAEAFLRRVPGSDGYFAAAMKASDLHCLDAAARRSGGRLEMRLKPETLRDALYPALYRRDFGKRPAPTGFPAVPAFTISTEFDGPLDTLPPDFLPRRQFGECVARAAPQTAHDLLLAEPWSSREDAAVEQLKPAMSGCLEAGVTARANRAAIRASLGEAMYKLSRAAIAAQS